MYSTISADFWSQLLKIMRLPENIDRDTVRRCIITAEAGNIVKVDLEYYPSPINGETITQRFKLIPFEEETN